MPSPVLGIDLGTTNSVVAVADEQRVRVLRDEEGRFLTPSTVSFLDATTTLVGHQARDRRLIDVENTVFSVKRLIGRPYRSAEVRRAAERLPFKLEEGQTGGVVVRVRNEAFSLPEISSFILRRLRTIAEQALGQQCQSAVITVPANFNELQRMATRDAGRIAGLNVLRILNEPTAAALAYGYRAQQQQRIAVYDFGGGTFDISILELSGDVIEVVATAGDTHLGGDDLDRALADRMVAEFKTKHGIDLSQQPQQYQRVTLAAEWLKCQLSDQDAGEVTVRQVALASGTPIDLKFKATRSELQELCLPLITRTFTICEDALRLAGVRPAQLDGVILVGGQTRTPKVREMVAEYFGIQPKYSVDPDLAVSQGAALQGYALSGVPAANKERLSPVRTLAGPGARPAPSLTPAADTGGFEDEPTRVDEPRRLVPPPAAGAQASRLARSAAEQSSRPSVPRGDRGIETPFDDMPTTISRRDPDFEPTKVGEVRIPIGNVKPYGAIGTHPSTLSGVGATPGSARSDDEFTAADVLELLAGDSSVRETLAETPHAKAGTRPSRVPGARSSNPPAPAAVTPLVPAPSEAVELPAALRHDEPDAYEEFDVDMDPSTTLMERPSAKAKTRPPSAAAPPKAASPSVNSQAPVPQGRDDADDPTHVDLPRLAMPLVGGAAANSVVIPAYAPTPIPAPAVQSLQSTFPGPPSVAPLLLDVTPHTLCVETVGGFCEQIIERNAPIPTEQTRVFSTSRDNQATVSVRVCQGESRRTDENQVLGQIDLLGLRQARRGEVSIAVTFVIDADGTLNVRAIDEGTGRGQEIQVNLVGAIGGPEIERMRARQRGLAS